MAVFSVYILYFYVIIRMEINLMSITVTRLCQSDYSMDIDAASSLIYLSVVRALVIVTSYFNLALHFSS